MSNNSLQRYLRTVRPPVLGIRSYTPILLSDSKGYQLYNQVRHHTVDNSIIWWGDSSYTTADGIDELKSKIARARRRFGNIWLYFWLGTCDLTCKERGQKYIDIRSETEITVNSLSSQYQQLHEVLDQYPDVKYTILKIPHYSIESFNKYKGHQNHKIFADKDNILWDQIDLINSKIDSINQSIGSYSPHFSLDLYRNSKYKRGNHRTPSTRHYYNFNLYTDGIHPDQLLSQVWLKRISIQMYKDCWN